jgi:hypothetical protein
MLIFECSIGGGPAAMGKKTEERNKAKISKGKGNRSSNKTIFIAVGILVLAALIFSFFYQRGNTKPALIVIDNPDTLPGIQVSEVPWPPEFSHLRERLKMIGLPAMSEEGTNLHSHQHIKVFIKGSPVQVPSGIGSPPQFITTIHTHDATGEIHIESPTVQTFTLGQFFDVWGVRFSSKCIGSYCEDQQNSVKVFVDGKAVAGDPRTMALIDQQEIVVAYGKPEELPKL